MWGENFRLPTTSAILQTSAAVLSDFSYKILAFSNFSGSDLDLPPVLPRALADERPVAVVVSIFSRNGTKLGGELLFLGKDFPCPCVEIVKNTAI
jgi:hypothetical protein